MEGVKRGMYLILLIFDPERTQKVYNLTNRDVRWVAPFTGVQLKIMERVQIATQRLMPVFNISIYLCSH